MQGIAYVVEQGDKPHIQVHGSIIVALLTVYACVAAIANVDGNFTAPLMKTSVPGPKSQASVFASFPFFAVLVNLLLSTCTRNFWEGSTKSW